MDGVKCFSSLEMNYLSNRLNENPNQEKDKHINIMSNYDMLMLNRGNRFRLEYEK